MISPIASKQHFKFRDINVTTHALSVIQNVIIPQFTHFSKTIIQANPNPHWEYAYENKVTFDKICSFSNVVIIGHVLQFQKPSLAMVFTQPVQHR